MRIIRTIALSLLTGLALVSCTAPPAVEATATLASTAVPSTPTRSSPPTRTPIPSLDAASLQPGQHAYSFLSSSGAQVPYLLYLPENFSPDRDWPLILFLHGSSERGGTPEGLKYQYMAQMLEVKKDLPFIVVSPVLPTGQWVDFLEPVDELLSHLEESLPVDSQRMYLTGLSLGGFGTWAYALQYPDRFAAIAPISGGYMHGSKEVPQDICKLKDVAVWVFHGDRDDGVRPFQAQVMVDALGPCGGEVKYTLYPNTGHSGAWFNAYEDPALYEWFLEHER